MAATQRTKPGVGEVAHGLAKEILIKAKQFGPVDHAFDRRVVARGFAIVVAGFVGMRDAFESRMGGIEQALGGEPFTHRGAGGHDEITVKKPRNIKVAVFFQATGQFAGLVETIGGATDKTESVFRHIEGMAAGR